MKKNNIITIAIIAITLFFTSCGSSKFNEEELSSLLFKYDKGILAGVDIGDNWDEIKANHNPEFTVREQEMSTGGMIYQLRKDYNDHNRIFIDFEMDENKNITSIKYDLTLENTDFEDTYFIQTLYNSFDDFFTNKTLYTVTTTGDDFNNWQVEKNNIMYEIKASHFEDNEREYGVITISIEPSK